jgi:hypothetical protein
MFLDQHLLALSTKQESPMRKIIALLLLTFALVAGTAAVVTIHPQPAFADPNGGGAGGGNGGN